MGPGRTVDILEPPILPVTIDRLRTRRRRPILRLLVFALALGLGQPALGQAQETSDADDVLEAGEAEVEESPRRRRRDPSSWTDWRNYQPSVIFGVGVTWDEADSSLEGVTRWSPAFRPDCIQPLEPIGRDSNCYFSEGSFSGFNQGGAINVGGRLRLPEFDLPSKPRLFVNASLVLQRQDETALANSGVPSGNWLSSGDFLGGPNEPKYLRLEQTIDPKTVLFLGVGMEFLLPVDLYPVRLNGSVNYFRTKADVGSRYDFVDTPEGTSFGSLQFETEELVTHGIAPGIGLDVDIGETRHLEFGFYADTFVGFILSDPTTTNTLRGGFPITLGQSDIERVDYFYERGINISVMVGIRVSLNND